MNGLSWLATQRAKLAQQAKKFTQHQVAFTRPQAVKGASGSPRILTASSQVLTDYSREGEKYIVSKLKEAFKSTGGFQVHKGTAEKREDGSIKLAYKISMPTTNGMERKQASIPCVVIHRDGHYRISPLSFGGRDLKTAILKVQAGESIEPTQKKEAAKKTAAEPVEKASLELESAVNARQDLLQKKQDFEKVLAERIQEVTLSLQNARGLVHADLLKNVQQKNEEIVALLEEIEGKAAVLSNTAIVALQKSARSGTSYSKFATFLTNFLRRSPQWFELALSPFTKLTITKEAVVTTTPEELEGVQKKTKETEDRANKFTKVRDRLDTRFKGRPYFKPEIHKETGTPVKEVVGQLEHDSEMAEEGLDLLSQALSAVSDNLKKFFTAFSEDIDVFVKLAEEAESSEGLPAPVTASTDNTAKNYTFSAAAKREVGFLRTASKEGGLDIDTLAKKVGQLREQNWSEPEIAEYLNSTTKQNPAQ